MIPNPKRHVGFVASGGGTKAWFFHVGVCLAMEEKGFVFKGGLHSDVLKTSSPLVCDHYVGSSGGAIFAALTAAGFSPKQQAEVFSKRGFKVSPAELFARRKSNRSYPRKLKRLRYLTGLAFNPRIFTDYLSGLRFLGRVKEGRHESLAYYLSGVSSPFSVRGIERYIRTALPSNNFLDLSVDLNVVSTLNDLTGNMNRMVFSRDEYIDPKAGIYYHNGVPISQAVAASCALPGLFSAHTVRVGHRDVDLIDGEIRRTLSSHVAVDKIRLEKQKMGTPGAEGIVIGSYTHVPYYFNKRYGALRKFGLIVNLQQAVYIAVASRIHLAQKARANDFAMNEELRRFFMEKGYPEEDIEECLGRINKRINFDPKIEHIYVSPDPQDADFFMTGNHFDLTAPGARHIVEKGYEAAVRKIAGRSFMSPAPVPDKPDPVQMAG